MKFVLFLILFVYTLNKSKDLDITEDFEFVIEHRVASSPWTRRGTLSFVQKTSSKNYKPVASILNDPKAFDIIDEVKTDCEANDELYYIRMRSGSEVFFGSIKTVTFFLLFLSVI